MSDRTDDRTGGRRQDVQYLVVLLVVAAGVGAYVLNATALIARDGVSYIVYAQQLAQAPLSAIAAPPESVPASFTPGYPLLILFAHTIGQWFGAGPSIVGWVRSAQIAALVCRALAVIPLYFIGKRLVGAPMSFWGLMILAVLPYPARFGSDALRDWPGLLMLATGFALLCRAARTGGIVSFLAAGAASGLGYAIRPVCGQIVLYAMLWSSWRLARPADGLPPKRVLVGAGLLVVGFVLTAGPFMIAMGRVLVLPAFSASAAVPVQTYLAGFAPQEALEGLWAVLDRASESLMYYFVPALLVGTAAFVRRSVRNEQTRLFGMFLVVNVALLVVRYCFFGHVLSRRYVLPLVAFTAALIPLGLAVMAHPILRLLRLRPSEKARRTVIAVLLIGGFASCMPKLLAPVRPDKAGYIAAGRWLRQNTSPDCRIAVPDWRIQFYADREASLVKGIGFPGDCDYVVKIYSPGQKQMISADFPRLHAIELAGKKPRTLVIFQVAANARKWQVAR